MTRNSGKNSGSGGARIVYRTLADGTVKEYRYDRKKKTPRQPTGALRQIFNAYSESPEFKGCVVEWRTRKLWLMNLIEERLGWMTLADLEHPNARRKFYELRDAYADLPHRADKMIQSLSSILEWAIDRSMLGYNHAARMGALASSRKHVATYTEEMHARLIAELPREINILYLMALYTGARRGDLIDLKWSQIDSGGWLTFTPSKTSKTTAAVVSLPTRVLKPLAGLLDSLPRESAHILTQLNGYPWYEVNVSKRWQRQMEKMGYAGMRFHDIRHTTATNLVEAGCTEAERGAIMGHAVSSGSGIVYVARTKQLSENAYRKWNDYLSRGQVIPLENASVKRSKDTA